MTTVYMNFDMIDVAAGQLRKGCFMEVEGGKITALGKKEDYLPSAKTEQVDLSQKTVMPGLFDCHIHAMSTPIANPASLNGESQGKFALRGLVHLRQHLRSGVTFCRDMNGRKQAEVGLKELAGEALFQVPRLQICRQCLTMTGGTGSNTGRECDGPEECRKAAREQLKGGADFIKIMATGGIMSPGTQAEAPQLDEEEIRAAVREAHKAGKKAATHAHGAAGILNAVRAGIDSVEHGTYVDERCIELMLEKGTFLVPTLSIDHSLLGHEGEVSKEVLEKSKRVKEVHTNNFIKAWKAGVKIAAGTDAGTPFNLHGESWKELLWMVEAGMSPMEAIRSATWFAAELMGVRSWTGNLEPGKAADFLILGQSPLDRIENLSKIERVILNGEPVRPL